MLKWQASLFFLLRKVNAFPPRAFDTLIVLPFWNRHEAPEVFVDGFDAFHLIDLWADVQHFGCAIEGRRDYLPSSWRREEQVVKIRYAVLSLRMIVWFPSFTGTREVSQEVTFCLLTGGKAQALTSFLRLGSCSMLLLHSRSKHRTIQRRRHNKHLFWRKRKGRDSLLDSFERREFLSQYFYFSFRWESLCTKV